jgi:flagellar hook assembly protein FlgD
VTITATFTVSPTTSATPSATITATAVIGPLIKIHAIYPNPFEDHGTIFYVLKFDSLVEITIFNVAGEIIYNRQEGPKAHGNNLFVWKGENNAGARVASGTYPIVFKALALNGEQDQFWDFAVVSR